LTTSQVADAAELTIRDVPGIRVGHATNAEGRTGCTVVLLSDGAVAGVDVRGSAPGTRETDLLRATALVERIDALCLTGGSAFGLAAADGVMRRMAELGRGFETGVRRVPIVPAATIFDLGVGSSDATPGPDDGYAACLAAEGGDAGEGPLEGSVGAGTGATVGKIAGPQLASPGGVGSAAWRLPSGITVGALAVTNGIGNVIGRNGEVLAGAWDPTGSGFLDARILISAPSSLAPQPGNTTLAVVATDAPLDRAGCRKLAELGHDALALAISPVHTAFDGDTVFALSTGRGTPLDAAALLPIGAAAVEVLRSAIERSVRAVQPGNAGT
jgi:L-aminopeptidase/D-esterase-like protein